MSTNVCVCLVLITIFSFVSFVAGSLIYVESASHLNVTTAENVIDHIDDADVATLFSSVARYCPARGLCENINTELGRWDCLGKTLYFTTALDNDTTSPLQNERFVVSDCGGVGFGNAIRGYYSAVSIAATLGRRIIVDYSPMQRMFLPPYSSSWDYNLQLRLQQDTNNEVSHPGINVIHYKYSNTEHFDFEAHGRSPGRFLAWSNNLKSSSYGSPEWQQYSDKHMLNAGICGGEREMLTTGNCLPKILKNFVNCVTKPDRYQHLNEFELSIPFYYSLFRRPGPKLLKTLRTIRKRIGGYYKTQL